MSSVNSTNVAPYYLRILTVCIKHGNFHQFRGVSYSQIDAFPTQTYTHTHKKNTKAVVSSLSVQFGIRSFFVFFLELKDVFRNFHFRARGSSFSTDFGVLHTSWFGFAFDRFRVILLRARGSPFSIELRVFRFRPRGSSLSASSSTWFLIN